MRKFLTLISAAAILATPAFAQARGFDSDFTQAVTGPIKLEIVVSEELAHRTNNLPTDISHRNSTSRVNATFSNNGKFGDRAIEYLLKEMNKELVRDFDKRGLILSESAPTVLRVTIDRVKPNRPTVNQIRQDPNLSFQSFGTGGASVSAEFIQAGGTVVGTATYDYFSSFGDRTDLESSGVWTDADRAFSRFAKKITKKLAAMNKGSS